MDNNDLNPLERFVAKRELELELELEHKAVAPLERPAHLSVSAPVPAMKYPGIGRPTYTAGHLGIAALSFVLAFLAVLYEVPRETLMSAVTFTAVGTSFALTAARLQNLGKSLWWLGVWLIPFVGFYIAILCLAAPTGHAQHRKMDTAGGAIIAALAALVTIVIALAVFG
jgi:hypothetical protein